MEEDIPLQDRKYVEVYEHVSHEIQQKKDLEQIVRELMADGYEEKDAIQWVAAVYNQLRTRMMRRSLAALIPGLILLLLGLALRIATLYAWLPDASTFETGMIVIGAILTIWGLASWASYKDPPARPRTQ